MHRIVPAVLIPDIIGSITDPYTLTISGTFTASRVYTAPDQAGTLPLLERAQTFIAAQTIDLGTGALPAPNSGLCLRVANVDGSPARAEFIGFGGTGFAIIGRSTGGTRAAQTATPDGQAFFAFNAQGHDGAALKTTTTAFLGAYADGVWSSSNNGSYIKFSGTSNGATSNAEWMRLQNGALGIGAAPTTGNGLLQLASGTTKANGIAFGTDTFLYRSAAGILNFAGATYSLAIPTITANDTVATLGVANTFTAAQTINLGTGVLPAAISTPALRFASATFAGIEGCAAGSAGLLLIGRAAGGSWAAVAATDNGRNMINLAAYGHDGTNWKTTPSAVQRILAGSAWTGSSQETLWTWEATPAGSTTKAEWMRLQGGASEPTGMGALLIGTATLTSGNGLLQLASGTFGKAYGIAMGTGAANLYPLSAGVLKTDGGITIGATTSSTSTTTGSLVNAGGFGNAGAINGGDAITGPKCKMTPEGGFATRVVADEAIAVGSVVSFIQGGTANRVMKTPTTGNENDMPVGVAYSASTAAGDSIWIVTSGRVGVLPDTGVTAAQGYLITTSSTTAGLVAQAATAPAAATHFKEVGHFCNTGSGASAITDAIVHFN